jgi:hypothetical protein
MDVAVFGQEVIRVEKINTLRDINADVSRAIDRVKSDVDELIGDLDLEDVARRVESFGKSNPAALAVASLTIGIAAGLIIRKATSRT